MSKSCCAAFWGACVEVLYGTGDLSWTWAFAELNSKAATKARAENEVFILNNKI